MKKYLLLAALLLSAPAMADQSFCEVIHSLSAKVMEERQSGSSPVELINIVEKRKDEGSISLAKTIILDAYSHPLYSLPKNKQRQVSEFSTKYYLECMERFGN